MDGMLFKALAFIKGGRHYRYRYVRCWNGSHSLNCIMIPDSEVTNMTNKAEYGVWEAIVRELLVQQYAEAAVAAFKAQKKLVDGQHSPAHQPTNLGAMLQRSPSSNIILQKSPSASPVRAKASSGGGTKPSKGKKSEDMIDILLSCQEKAISVRTSQPGETAASSGGTYASEVSGEARRAAGMVRATLMRQTP